MASIPEGIVAKHSMNNRNCLGPESGLLDTVCAFEWAGRHPCSDASRQAGAWVQWLVPGLWASSELTQLVSCQFLILSQPSFWAACADPCLHSSAWRTSVPDPGLLALDGW